MTYVEEIKQAIEYSENPMTVQEVMRIMKFSDAKVYRLIKDGEIKAINIGSGKIRPLWVVDKQSLIDFLTRRSK